MLQATNSVIALKPKAKRAKLWIRMNPPEASTVIIGRISQLETLGYFAKGSTCEPGEEVVPEPADDEAIIFEEFFTAGLRMSPQPVLTDILVKFHMRLHQLTLNSLTQLSKYFRAVMSFSGEPSSDGFAKR
jgi:hypothetical protein